MARKRCKICASKKFRSTDLGFYVCENGHQLEHSADMRNDDVAEFGRAIRTKKRRKADTTTDDEKQPKEGFLLFRWSILQWLLNKQVAAIVSVFGVAPAFELAVKSLWFEYAGKVEERCIVHGETYTGRQIKFQDTLLICYLGLLRTNHQILLADLHRMTLKGQVPFIGIFDDLPEDRRKRLVKEMVSSNIMMVPHVSRMYFRLFTILRIMRMEPFPAFEHAVFAHRLVEITEMSPVLYTMAKRLVKLENLTFDYTPVRRQDFQIKNFPCVRLAAMYIFLLKLEYGFEGSRFVRGCDGELEAVDFSVDEFLDKFETNLKTRTFHPTNTLEWSEFQKVEDPLKKHGEYWETTLFSLSKKRKEDFEDLKHIFQAGSQFGNNYANRDRPEPSSAQQPKPKPSETAPDDYLTTSENGMPEQTVRLISLVARWLMIEADDLRAAVVEFETLVTRAAPA